MCIDVGAENGVHAGQVALAARFESLDHIAVQAQVHAGLAAGHDDSRGLPTLGTETRCARRNMRS